MKTCKVVSLGWIDYTKDLRLIDKIGLIRLRRKYFGKELAYECSVCGNPRIVPTDAYCSRCGCKVRYDREYGRPSLERQGQREMEE